MPGAKRPSSAVLGLVLVAALLAACQTAASPGESVTGSPPCCAPSESEGPGESGDGSGSTFELTSSAFGEGEAIPQIYGCEGDNLSPPLEWSGAPEDTVAYALVMDDRDAAGFVHWVVGNITAMLANFPEGYSAELPEEAAQGETDAGRTGYVGPCPVSGTHRYVFTLYALSEPSGVSPGVTASELLTAIEGKVLGEAVLSGTYGQ